MPDSTKKHQIKIDSGRSSPARGVYGIEGVSLLENLISNQIDIDHSCGGNGTCGTCCVQVMEGLEHFSDRNEIESEMKQDRGFKENERLCCQSYIHGPVFIKIP